MAQPTFDFEIDGKLYRATPIPTIKAFHVGRKLAPLMAGAAAIAPQLMGEGGAAPFSMAEFRKVSPAILANTVNAISDLPDKDADFVLETCLVPVMRQDTAAFARIYNASAKTFLYDDISLKVMCAILVKMLSQVFADFLAGNPSTEGDGGEPAAMPGQS